jgi:hypothetical protein
MLREKFETNDFDDYLNKRYVEEQAEKRALYTRASITFTVLSFVLVSFVGLLKNLPVFNNVYSNILLILLVITSVLLLFSFYFFVKILAPKTFAYLPNMSSIIEFPDKLKKYYAQKNEICSDSEIVTKSMNNLRNSYIKTIDYDFKVNRKKSEYLTDGTFFVTLSLLLIVLTSVYYNFIPKCHFRENTNKVLIKNDFIKLTSSDSIKDSLFALKSEIDNIKRNVYRLSCINDSIITIIKNPNNLKAKELKCLTTNKISQNNLKKIQPANP